MAHIITAVIGSGVLSLAWSTSQLGWIGGPVALLCFAIITYVSSSLLSDCYRTPDPVTGKRNYSYMAAVRVNLGSELFPIPLCDHCSVIISSLNIFFILNKYLIFMFIL